MRYRLTLIVLVLVALITAPAWATTYPATDTFSGSGALSSNWTNTTETSDFTGTLVQSSGQAVPSPSGTVGLATYTGAGFTNNQYAQAKILANPASGNNNTGPCVRMDTNGNGYCYFGLPNGQLWLLQNGDPLYNNVPGTLLIHWQVCPVPSIGDTIQISAVGTTITCKDVTTGASASVTDSTFSSGNPGIMVDQRGPSGYGLGSFQADCIPSCGGGTAPSIALTPGIIGSLAGVQGGTTAPTSGGVASGHSIGAPVGIAVAPMINGAGGDIYFAPCGTAWNCAGNSHLYVIYEGGAAAKAILIADGIASPTVGDTYTLTSSNETGPYSLNGITVDSYGNVLVADWGYSRVYMFYAGTVSGQGTNPADALLTADPSAWVVGYGLHAGYAYHVADGGSIVGSAPTTPQPNAVYVDSAENVFFTDRASNGVVEVVYNTSGTSANAILTAEGYTSLKQGYTYIVAGGQSVTTYPNDNDSGSSVAYNGGTSTANSAINGPWGISGDSAGNIYFADSGSNKIKKLSASAAVLTTVGGPAAGTATTVGHGGDGGLATAAQMNTPYGLVADKGGSIYFADTVNGSVRRIDKNGYISTVAGTSGSSGTYAGDGGNATAATLGGLDMMSIDASGNLYISDRGNDLIEKVATNAAAAGTVISTAVNNSGKFTYEGSFAFGNQAVNTSSSPATALITNITASSVTLGGISIPSGYTQALLGNTDVPDCTTTTAIAPGTSCTLALKFSPTVSGADNGSVMIIANGEYATIAVTGMGTGGTNTVATPTFSPAAGTYSSAQTVTLSDATSGATIYYTTNGTTPTTSSTVYSGPITVSASETVKALATKSGYTNSAVGSAAYTINSAVATPTFSPAAGTYSSAQTVTISDSTAGATLYYTTNGTTPTTSSPVYSTPITVSTSETVEALGVKSGYTNSAIGSAAYTISGTKTLTAVAISPQGAAIQSGSTQQFSVTCTYSDHSTDNCAAAGGATWSTSSLTALSVNSSGLATWNTDPGAGGAPGYHVLVSAGGITDSATVYGQHPGDTWYQYPTPDFHNYRDSVKGTQFPLNVVVGSTVTMGSAISINDASMLHTATPFQSVCNWSSSDTGVATVDRHGQMTAVAPGTATITCGAPGNAVFGNSTLSGWISPGNTINLTVVPGGASNTTWYVRPDGGTIYSSTNTNGQCSGQVNAAYSGSGTDQPCAAGNIRYLWADGVTYEQVKWVISGGDTVIVAQNSAGYNTGADSPASVNQYNPTNCAGNYSGCYMPTVPSGTAARHTRILGANYANCHADSAKTLLNVSYGAGTAFNVKDSQFVDIACFEVSDQANCGGNGNFTNHCTGTNDNGAYGILESALTGDVTYTDLFIHGLADEGIHGATGVGVVGTYVHLRAMPIGGIDMDDDPWNSGNISVAGGLTLTNSITEWTGCVEEYPVVHNYPYIECRDQNAGGYADGFGTGSTTGNWYFNHDIWQYNFQDGLDLLHSGMQNLTVLNSLSLGNDGQAYKIGSGNNVVFQNNIAMVNCNRIAYVIGDEPSSAIVPTVSTCRAGGDGIVFSFTNLGTYTIQNNTYVGYNATPFDFGCEGGWDFCQNAASTYQNNLFMGYSDPLYSDGQLPGLFYEENSSMPPNGGWATRNHNIFYRTRTGYCPSPLQAGESCTEDPLFISEPASPISAESDLDGFNFKPSSSSPAAGAGVAIPGLTTDYNGTTRPNPPSIGAIEP